MSALSELKKRADEIMKRQRSRLRAAPSRHGRDALPSATNLKSQPEEKRQVGTPEQREQKRQRMERLRQRIRSRREQVRVRELWKQVQNSVNDGADAHAVVQKLVLGLTESECAHFESLLGYQEDALRRTT